MEDRRNKGDRKNRSRPHPVRHVFFWILGIAMILFAIFLVLKGELLAALILLAMTVVILPPAVDFLYLRFGIDLCKMCRSYTLFFGTVLFFLALE